MTVDEINAAHDSAVQTIELMSVLFGDNIRLFMVLVAIVAVFCMLSFIIRGFIKVIS